MDALVARNVRTASRNTDSGSAQAAPQPARTEPETANGTAVATHAMTATGCRTVQRRAAA
eukprot:CAMPEP_0179344214 /NCGR_PEP_ID=MMETSP0797-20121207/71389_1 /TAXON_ID=47934 /ORGANISM="Dinophysis acuminata, Strain DAEP01" /LENGTH=59 /DNA_ID=CAMNT_0021058617 /DNA_START=123 /DNA_END=302 /DNA_ORIENTATION=-